MPEEPEEKPEQLFQAVEVSAADIPVTRSPEYQSYWSNSLQFLGSQFDMRLVFCMAAPDEHGNPIVQQMCSVAMSYENAKALAIVLNKNIRDRERDFGPIYIVPRPPAPTNKK